MANDLAYRPRTADIPQQAGVYRFLDANGRVLYVGKAKSLRNRLSNYFAPLGSLHERTRRMVTAANGVEWTVVANEIEALQLEYLWINEFDPPFNVQFRDDKSYPYIAVTLADEAPRVIVTRRKNISGARYFGPFPQVWAVHETLALLRTMFPMRTCKESDYKRAMSSGRPCFGSQIGKCHGPCSQRVSVADHRAIVDQFLAFMVGQDRSVVRELNAAMKSASAVQDYERAAILRDQIAAANAFFAQTNIVLREGVDADVFGIAHDGLSAAVQLFIVRGGIIRGVQAWTVNTELDVAGAELAESVLQHAYLELTPAPEILLAEPPASRAALQEVFSGLAGRSVLIHVPQRGEKVSLLNTATQNATHALMLYKSKRNADFTTRSKALEDIQFALEMDEAPLRIECFDISHLSGTNIVASMVVFEDGLPRKDQYRRFNIAHATDDTDAMYQVLSRRLARLGEVTPDENEPSSSSHRFAYPPQLILVDGGQPQVAAAARALQEADVTGIAIAGIAKRLEELWLPNSDFPAILARSSEALFLIQRVRDEAHRFAITHQRKRRGNDLKSILNEIPGLGAAKTSALLKHFGSVRRLREADTEELASVPGIGTKLARTIRAHFEPAPGAK